MTIPPKYEDVVAELEAANELARKCNDAADRQHLRAVNAEKREAALREELSKLADDYCKKVDDLVALQQRLTVAEQRNTDNLKLISGLVEYADNLLADVNNAWSYAG